MQQYPDTNDMLAAYRVGLVDWCDVCFPHQMSQKHQKTAEKKGGVG